MYGMFFLARPQELAVFQGWEEVAESRPFASLRIRLDQVSILEGLVRGGAIEQPVLVRTGGGAEAVYRLSDDFRIALGNDSDDSIKDTSVVWAESAAWAGTDVNPFDLCGFLLHLSSLCPPRSQAEGDLYVWLLDW